MSTNYSEQIFQSIDTIISQRLNEVSFDKTEICEIVSQDKDNVNKYWVSNGSLKYEAYSIDENRKYLANQKVYVTIPQGNYDLRKLIIGSYSADETNENLYVNPFNHLVTSSSHEVSDIIIITNTLGNSTSNFKDLNVRFNYSNTIDFDYIGLEFGLDTSSLQGTYKGTYSIELQIYNNEDKQLNTSRIILYNTDLYGNPYSLIPMLKFQHLFPFPKEIENITDIAKIRVLLAQDGNFEKIGNIKLQDIKLYFGYDTKTITKDELQLILEEEQSLKYTTGQTAAARNLYLDWKHFDISNTPYIFNINQSPNIFEYYKVYWLHYVDGLGENVDLPDIYAWNWETITDNTDLTQGITLTTLYRTDQYKAVIKYKYQNNETIYYAESTGLVFDNKNVAAEPGASNSSEDSLRIKLNEGDTGVYNIYGLDGRMIDYSYKGPHNIHFEFLDTTPLDRIASINWEFPSENTMIKDVADTDKQQATFNIDTMYKPGAMNNRIWCTVTLVTGEIRRGSLTLQFGETAAAGSNYAFNIDFIGHRTCLYATGEEDRVEIQAIFTKQNGEVMTVPTITWSWMNDYDSPITLSSSTGEKITLTYNNSEVPEENYSILQAEISDYAIDNGLTTNLTAYLPIPIAKPEYNYISGATRVVYDSNGNTATYSRNPYELYNLTNKIENTSWDIISNSTNDTFQLKTQSIRDENGNIIGEEKTLLPLSYIPKEPPMTCIYCILNENIVWSQPILIIQNRWEYDLLNEWNGQLKSDGENYVLAPLLGAGKKEGDNGFTGVLMGNLRTAEGQLSETGLYGFKEGSRRFSFNDKGEAYIGTGDYYINFDSEDLTIKAKNFDLNANNGALVISNEEGIKLGDKISINPNGTAKIGGWNIGTTSLSFPSTDTSNHDPTNWLYFGQNNSASLKWNDTTTYSVALRLGNGFGVTTGGKLYAQGAQINGDITATNLTLTGSATIPAAKVSGKLTSAEIDASKITSGTIDSNRIAADSITASKLDITTLSSITANLGTITAGTIDASKVTINNLSVKNANVESLSFSKITSGTGNSNSLTASNFNITGGSINMFPNPGYLVFGTSVSSHPYVSALNVAHGSGGIVIRNGQFRNDIGEEIGYIDAGSGQYLRILTAIGKNMNITGRANMAIEISKKSSLESNGYLKIATNPYHNSGDGSMGSNPGSVYIYSHAHITLHAGHNGSEGHVYVGHGTGNNFRVAIDSSGPSSLNLKTNLQKFDDKTYNEALQLLSELQLYNYTYKYNNLHPKKEQFGFIIDELLENELANKFFYFRDEVAGITQSNNIDYAALDEGNPYNEPIIHFKRYDEETLIKYLLVCNKALLQQIEGLKQEIKEIKQNEI